jgi:hypothetical protein
MTEYKKYGEWKKSIYTMNNYNFQELEIAIKLWIVEEGFNSNDLKISVISTNQIPWQKDYNIKYKITGNDETHEIMSNKLRLNNRGG